MRETNLKRSLETCLFGWKEKKVCELVLGAEIMDVESGWKRVVRWM